MNAIERAALHQAIMNLPCYSLECSKSKYAESYRAGHRDARHAAAELVLAAEPAERPDITTFVDACAKQLLGVGYDLDCDELHKVVRFHMTALADWLRRPVPHQEQANG